MTVPDIVLKELSRLLEYAEIQLNKTKNNNVGYYWKGYRNSLEDVYKFTENTYFASKKRGMKNEKETAQP